MGNVLLLPCVCKEDRVAVQETAAGGKKTKRIKRPAVANNVVTGEDQDGGEEKKKKAWPGSGEYGVRLKVVVTRKDAKEFMARLEEQAAAERKARRMAELGSGGMVSPSRDAWRPRLATIPETES
jgi:hypothetical protein